MERGGGRWRFHREVKEGGREDTPRPLFFRFLSQQKKTMERWKEKVGKEKERIESERDLETREQLLDDPNLPPSVQPPRGHSFSFRSHLSPPPFSLEDSLIG